MALMLLGPGVARAERVQIFAAGSLKPLVQDITPRAAAMGIEIEPVFGGSGVLREQIEHGAKPDMLLSADLASPAKLFSQKRAIVPPIAFARNRLCLVVRRSLELSPDNLIARLLAPTVRIRTSPPGADPSGDYAMALFDRIDQVQRGAGRILRAKAAASWKTEPPTGTSAGNPVVALFVSGQIDVAVTYCSATPALIEADGDLVSVAVPPRLAPKPVLGLALLSESPAAARLALYLLSLDGQAAVARVGLLPLLDPDAE